MTGGGVKILDTSKLKITDQEFSLFCDYLENACGILLARHKLYLVESRLGRLMKERDIPSLATLVEQLKRPGSRALNEQVINAMTTNETLWFRDIHPYTILNNQVLPELAAAGSRQRLRIWSAACSTGQEPYSISMSIEEFRQSGKGSFGGEEIVATDICTRVLQQAKTGDYERLALGRGLSQERLKRFFSPKGDDIWTIKPELKRRINFRELNLLGSYSTMGQFDIIFCRNVLIYFSTELKLEILRKMHKSLKKGGYLFLGASESLSGLSDCYEMIHCRPGIIYKAI